MANLGFIGLGVMGGNMVARLLEKGHTVTGFNRTRSKAQWLIDKGMKCADSPRVGCGSVRRVFTHGHECRGADGGRPTGPMACSPALARASFTST